MSFKALCCVVAVGLLALGAVDARADSITGIGFVRITDNNVEDVAGQFNLDILTAADAFTDYGLSLGPFEVLFAWSNSAVIASSISEIYIANFDGTVLLQTGVYNSLDGFTLFAGPGADPRNLPGGADVDPIFTANPAFSADAQGNPDRGVDEAADVLGVAYVALGGVDAIRTALEDGRLRLGMHVRAIGAAGGSDGFVSEYDPSVAEEVGPAVPEPASMALVALGLLGALGLARRRRRA